MTEPRETQRLQLPSRPLAAFASAQQIQHKYELSILGSSNTAHTKKKSMHNSGNEGYDSWIYMLVFILQHMCNLLLFLDLFSLDKVELDLSTLYAWVLDRAGISKNM